MMILIEKMESGKIKGKRNIELAELIYNHNGKIVTANLNHINSAYNLLDMGIPLTIERIDYSSDHVITAQ